MLKQALFVLGLPFVMGAQGDGCAAGSTSPAPDVTGAWDIAYDDAIDVEVKIGGQLYTSTLGPNGGEVTVDHAGASYTFDLDCGRPEIVCPSEAWPRQVVIEQRDINRQHQMIVNLPAAQCDGDLMEPERGSCGTGTTNPNCDLVCEGEVTVATTEAFGVIGETGSTFRLFLGGGIVTNGWNCALLGYSVADAELVTTGVKGADWEATEMAAGLVTIGYAGGCLFKDMSSGADMTLAVGAEVKFLTGFTGARR
jgi:hypothetical protein